MDKKTEAKGKAGVKFADKQALQQADASQTNREKDEKPKIILSLEDCRSTVIKIYNEADTAFKLATKNDPEAKRKDTARALCKILETIKEALTLLNNQGSHNKEKLYYLTYNGTIYCFEICRALRKSVYSALTVQYIAYCILSMEKNITLVGIKYLDWRVKLYVELAHIYEDCESYKASGKAIETAIQKVNELKDLEESDPPVPEHISMIIANNLRILKALDVKYKLHNGLLAGEAWKKKMEEYFKGDIDGRNMAIIESLNPNYKKHNNIVTHYGKTQTWKDPIVNFCYDMLKADIEMVAKGLEQINTKMNYTVQIKEDMTINEQTRGELVTKMREFDNTMLIEKEWRKAAANVPIEVHIEVLKHAYDVNNQRVYSDLLQSALTRCKYRRIEVPYITDIDIQFSTIPHSNIPNGYEKINIDINDAHLKTELAKLRISIAKEIAKQQEEKKLEKLKDGKKAGKKEEKEDKVPNPSDIAVDPSNVAHNYIYFLVKRSYSPERAIYGVEIVMAHPETGPKEKLNQGWECKAIKIDQYTGVRETTNLIPWLCLKHSDESLKDEEEKKTLLVDFMPILAKHYLIRPKFGFEKINVDLRQVPQQFYKIPNLDFVYVSYKTDKLYPVCERELMILKQLEEVEKTYRGTKSANDDEEIRAQLDLNYNIDKLQDLAKTVKYSLDGPLGDYFYDARKDFLVKFAFYVWKKYIVSSLYQIETLYELRITEEITAEDFRKYENILRQAKLAFVEVLEALSKIMMKSEVIDIVWLAKINIELCKLLEEFEEYRKAAQILRFALNKIVEFKDKWFSRGVESKKDVFLPLTITCNNGDIHKMIEEMKNKYFEWKTWLRKEIRAHTREKLGTKALEDDEAQEEDHEFVEISKIYGHDDLKDQQYTESTNFDREKAYTEYFSIVNAIHTDLTINMIRCELKAGKQSHKLTKMKQTDKYTTTLKNPEGIESIPARMKARLNIMGGLTTTQVKKNATQLQTTLQTAGKLEPPKPKIQNYEDILLQETNNNSYLNALLYMTMAGSKSKYPEQKYLLNESMKFIRQAEEEEKMHIRNGIENAVYLFSTLLDDRNAEKKNDTFYPFTYLYNPEYIKPSVVPQKPILISRTTTTITLKLPPFTPIIGELALLENPKLKIVNLMSVYGKVSQNGVDVSTTSTDLQNTGTRFNNGAIVTLTNLRINEKYCFAAAGYNPQEKVINGIGKTGEDIGTVCPLPINMLYAYLAINCYQIGYFELSEEASEKCGNFFCEKTDIKERSLDYADNPIYLYRLKLSALKNFSQVELKIAALNYIVHARCLQRKFKEQEKNSKNEILYISKQKNALMVCNYLMLALELACATKSFPMAKRIIKELYNDIIPFLSFRTKSKFIFQILVKAQLLIAQIPKEIWDGSLRSCSIKITYEILRSTLQFNEVRLSKLILYYENRLPHRKWFILSKTIMVEEAAQPDPKDAKDAKKVDPKAKKPVSKAAIRDETKPNEPPKLVPKTIREIMAKITLQDNLEEFLLSLGEEYYDSVVAFIDFWKEQLETFKPYIDNGPEIIDKKKGELMVKFEFWDIMRDQNLDIAKIKPAPQYLEFVCKLLKKGMDKGMDLANLLGQVAKVVEPTSETITLVNQIRDLRLRAIEGDIGWNPKMLEELIHEREINKQGDDLAIELYTQFWKLDQELREKATLDTSYEYNLKWLAEFNFIKATLLYIQLYRQLKAEPENKFEVYFDVTEIGDPAMITQPDADESGQASNKVKKPRMEQLTVIFKHLCYASTYANRAKTFYLLQNISKLSLNIFKIELLTPFDHQGTEFYQHITHLVENLNEMLEEIKTKQENKPQSSAQSQMGSVVRFEEVKEELPIKPSVTNSNAYLLDTYLTKDYWFWETDIDLQTIANNVAYCIKSLTVEQKWRVIVECSKHFCNVTHQFYSIYVLPFTENAQKMLYEQAREKTNAKRKQLDERTKLFEEWKKKQKRKKRADAMTGAVAQEQLDFERDEAELKKQIEIHKRIEDFYDMDKKRSSDLLATIKRDENQALENLNQGRNILAKYGNDRKEIFLYTTDPSSMKLKEKSADFWYRTVTSKYKEIIEGLKKKQENFALVQALHERGNAHFTMSDTKKYMQDWNEALDTIFQRIYTLKNFREVLQEYKNLGFQIGIERCLIGAVLLHKLANYGYHNDIHSQMECSLMAHELIFAIFRISMPHQFIPISYGAYRVKEILQDKDIFANKYLLNPGELIMACNYHALFLMDNGHHLKALPILGLMEYLAADITMSPYYSVKAKLLKAICLAQCGYINEAYMLMLIVQQEKDIVMGLKQNSEYYKKESGYNFFPNAIPYSNDSSPFDEKNKEPIENISKLEINSKFKFKYGFINHNLFYFAKASLTYSIFEVENYDKVELNDTRMMKLRSSEATLRGILKRLAFEDEFFYLKDKYTRIEKQEVPAEQASDPKSLHNQQLKLIKQHVNTLLDANEIEEAERVEYQEYRETTLKYSEVREERVSFIMRIRFFLATISSSMNNSSRAYHIVKNAITNLKKFSQDQRRVETADEPGVPEDVKYEDPKNKGKADPKKPEEKKKEEKKDDKKNLKKKDPKAQGGTEDEPIVKTEEELAKEFEEDQKFLKKDSDSRKTRDLFNGFWWLKLRTLFCSILFKQNKLEECQALINLFRDDSKILKDTFFIRTLEEIESKILLKKGNTTDGLRKLRKVIQHGTSYYHSDLGFGSVVGDFADVLFEKGDIEEAEQNYRMARQIFNNLLHEVRFEFKFQNTNQAALDEEIKISGTMQIPPGEEQNIMKSDKFKATKKDDKKPIKQEEKKKPDPKLKGKVESMEALAEMDVQPLNPLPNYDYSKENRYDLKAITEEKDVSNKLPFIYSLKIYEPYVKASLNYVRCMLWKSDYFWDQNTIVQALDEVNVIIQNVYNLPISFKFQLNFLYGKAFKRKFIEEFKRIHKIYEDKYLDEKNKKYRKLHNKIPHRDLLRNVYMIEIPNFSEELKETLIPYLDQAKDYLKKSINLLKGECLVFENGIKAEEAFIELSQVCLYLREYRPRPTFKYYRSEDLKAIAKEKGVDEVADFDKHLDELIKSDQKISYDLEWEAFNYLAYAIQACQAKLKLEEDFSAIGQSNFLDASKIPQDVFQMIIESDYQQKKTYGPKLFDENKKKTSVTSIDTVLFINRLAKESSVFSFTSSANQRMISKLHRFLAKQLATYSQSCVLNLTEVPSRSDPNALSLSAGTIIAKVFENPRMKEHRMMYILGPLIKEKIKTSITMEEINKIIMKAENQVLYGTLYFGHNEISEFLQQCCDLKSRMELSDKCSKEVRDRDYKTHRLNFAYLIARLAQKFVAKEIDPKSNSETASSASVITQQDEEDILEILDKHDVFVPDLTMANIQVLINLFSNIGLNSPAQFGNVQPAAPTQSNPKIKTTGSAHASTQQLATAESNEPSNHNYLALLRHFHKMKYK